MLCMLYACQPHTKIFTHCTDWPTNQPMAHTVAKIQKSLCVCLRLSVKRHKEGSLSAAFFLITSEFIHFTGHGFVGQPPLQVFYQS